MKKLSVEELRERVELLDKYEATYNRLDAKGVFSDEFRDYLGNLRADLEWIRDADVDDLLNEQTQEEARNLRADLEVIAEADPIDV